MLRGVGPWKGPSVTGMGAEAELVWPVTRLPLAHRGPGAPLFDTGGLLWVTWAGAGLRLEWEASAGLQLLGLPAGALGQGCRSQTDVAPGPDARALLPVGLKPLSAAARSSKQ